MELRPLFEIEIDRGTAIIVPNQNLDELQFDRIKKEGKEILRWFDEKRLRNAIVDFARSDYGGSSSLSFFFDLWKRVRDRDGRLAFCNVSSHEREVLRVAKFDSCWAICDSRADALALVGSDIVSRPAGQDDADH